MSRCPSCGDATGAILTGNVCTVCVPGWVLTPTQADEWLRLTSAVARDLLRADFLERPDNDELILAWMDTELVRSAGRVSGDYRGWRMLEALTQSYADRLGLSYVHAEDSLAAIVARSEGLTASQRLVYEVAQGSSILVAREDPAVTPVGLWNPKSYEVLDRMWTKWTLVAWGRAPGLERAETDFVRRLVRGDPDASLLGMAKGFGRRLARSPEDSPLLSLDNQAELQVINRYAPTVMASLRELAKKEGSIGHLAVLTECLKWNAKEAGATAQVGAGTVAWIDRQRVRGVLSEHGALEALNWTVWGRRSCVIPILAHRDHGFAYSPTLSDSINKIALNFRPVQADLRMSKVAGNVFEKLVALRLSESDCGYTTSIGDRLTVSVALTPRGQRDIDVVAWNDQEVVLVETKAEAEPPGAWSTNGVRDRTAALELYRSKLRAKLTSWQAHMRNGRSRVWIDGVESDIHAVWRSLPVRGAILSARIEPALQSPAPPLVASFLPSRAARVVAKHVPSAEVSGTWTHGRLP